MEINSHTKTDEKTIEEHVLWQSGSGADDKDLPKYAGYQPRYGYQMCSNAQAGMETLSNCWKEKKRPRRIYYKRSLQVKQDVFYNEVFRKKELFRILHKIDCV